MNVPDGLHYNVPFEDYAKWRYPSQSSLKAGRISMAHLGAALAGEYTAKVTDDMLLGSALGTAFLEPALMATRVVLWEGASRRGKDWEAFKVQHAGKVILTRSRFAQLTGMIASLRKTQFVREWLATVEHVEVSAVGVIEGVRVKGRADALPPGPIVDVKKVTSCDDRTIAKVCERLGYYIQGAIYKRLFNRDRFELLCVEGTAPYAVRRVTLTDKYLDDGYQTVCGILQAMKHCQATGVWPGYEDAPLELDVPAYRDSGADEVTIGGESAFGGGE